MDFFKKNKGMVITLAVIAVIALWSISAYNGMVGMDEGVQGKWADVETQYQRRSDLIPNLVDCVQAYDEHEYNTLKDVIAQRGTNTDAAAAEIKTMINAVAEQYPQLQSNTNYIH